MTSTEKKENSTIIDRDTIVKAFDRNVWGDRRQEVKVNEVMPKLEGSEEEEDNDDDELPKLEYVCELCERRFLSDVGDEICEECYDEQCSECLEDDDVQR